MKNKWYRSEAVKALAILLSYVAIVVAAFQGVILYDMGRAGINLNEENLDYMESGKFRETFHSDAYEILDGLRSKNFQQYLSQKGEIPSLILGPTGVTSA